MRPLDREIDDLRTNDAQWEAFRASSPCVVLAPPGSGKTKLLTTRMAKDLVESISPPHGAACITMTNSAASELRSRLQALRLGQRPNLFVGTVHSFALKCIVGPFARVVGLDPSGDLELVTQFQADAYMEQAIDDVAPETRGWARNKLGKSVDQWRNALGPGGDSHLTVEEEVAAVAVRFESLLREDHMFDFMELVRMAVELVENHEWVRRVLAARFPAIYVDEYQDLAPGLDRLVRSLCFDTGVSCDLFAVGDPDQAIFGFTGANASLLEELAERAEVSEVQLNQNYRSGQDLIDVAVNHLGRDVEINGALEGGEVVAIKCEGKMEGQIVRATELIESLRSSGQAAGEILVIAPTNDGLAQAGAALAEAGIGYFNRREVGYRRVATTEAVEQAALWLSAPNEVRQSALSQIIISLTRTGASPGEIGEIIGAVFALEQGHETIGCLEIAQCMSRAGLSSLERGSEEDKRELAQMVSTLSPDGELADLTVSDLGKRADAGDNVVLSTVFGAKGLEFDVVIALGVEDGAMPHFAATSQAELDQERNKLYVVITRARHSVFLLWSEWRETASGPRRAGPSPFLIELGLVD